MPKPKIEVEGAKELRKAIRKMESTELKEALKSANKAAAEVFVPYSKENVPVVSGKLRQSIRATGAQAQGAVRAGYAARVPYAGPVHFGWPQQNIKAQPFIDDAIAEHLGEGRAVYEEAIDAIVRQLETDLRYNFRS